MPTRAAETESVKERERGEGNIREEICVINRCKTTNRKDSENGGG